MARCSAQHHVRDTDSFAYIRRFAARAGFVLAPFHSIFYFIDSEHACNPPRSGRSKSGWTCRASCSGSAWASPRSITIYCGSRLCLSGLHWHRVFTNNRIVEVLGWKMMMIGLRLLWLAPLVGYMCISNPPHHPPSNYVQCFASSFSLNLHLTHWQY